MFIDISRGFEGLVPVKQQFNSPSISQRMQFLMLHIVLTAGFCVSIVCVFVNNATGCNSRSIVQVHRVIPDALNREINKLNVTTT